jgi:hypothetical protein
MPNPGIRQLPRTYFGGVQVQVGDVAPGNLLTKSLTVNPATVATTGSQELLVTAPCAGTLAGVTWVSKDALAASDTNYLTFTVVNKGQAGAGTTQMLAAAPANTTKATGGAAIAAYTGYPLSLSATPANLTVAKGDCLTIGIAATGTLANTVSEGNLRLEWAFTT